MQYDRASDGTLTALPKPSVDTGMGLERVGAVMQGVHSNYDIDLFQYLIKAAAKATNTDDLSDKSLRVIADHIRSCAFLIVDGVMPSNEGRGYVLRRIIRRAARHAHKLGMTGLFFHKLVAPLVEQMGEAYPELAEAKADVERILKLEEERFAETLDQGMRILDEAISKLDGKTSPGGTAFKLYDTVGFPIDLTADIAREHELEVDHAGFEVAMDEQRDRARSASQFGMDYNRDIEIESETAFTGYDHVDGSSNIKELFVDSNPVSTIEAGQKAIIILDQSPFYAESGGQVGDVGVLTTDSASFAVQDTQKQGNSILHIGVVESGSLSVDAVVQATIDKDNREAVGCNHSATHLMHAAFRELLGEQVQQKGS